MRKQALTLIAGILIGALAFGGIAVAADLVVVPSAQKVLVDGVQKTVDAYNINGSNYFKARDFAAAMDVGMWYNADTNSVMVETDKRYDANYDGTPTAATYSRTNPAPVGVTQTIKISNYFDDYKAEMTLDSVIRGAAAWEKIKAANQFNTGAADGKEYILAQFTVKVLSSKDDKAVSFGTYNFDLFTANNVEYDEFTWEVEPEPMFSGDVYEGGTRTGYVIFTVDTADSAPKAAYGRNYDGTGGLWFLLAEK